MKAKFELLLGDLCMRAKRPRPELKMLFMPQISPQKAAA